MEFRQTFNPSTLINIIYGVIKTAPLLGRQGLKLQSHLQTTFTYVTKDSIGVSFC